MSFDQGIAEQIVDSIAQGVLLDKICKRRGFPSRMTIWRWRQDNPDFDTQCARAREVSAAVDEDRIAGLVDSVIAKKIEPDAARVALNGLTWLAKVRAPKTYGEQVDVKHSGGVIVEVMQFGNSGKTPG